MRSWFAEASAAGWIVVSMAMIVVVLAACGRKGPPKAPELSFPGGVRFLSGAGQVDGVVLRWSEPAQELTSTKKPDVERYRIKRAVVSNEEAGDFETLAEVVAEEHPAGENADGSPAPASSPAAVPEGLPGLKGLKPARENVKSYTIADKTVQSGGVYDYEVCPVTHDGDIVDAQQILRVTFRGESSIFQARAVFSKKPKPSS